MYNKYNEYDMEIGPFDGEHGCNNYPESADDIYDPMCWPIENFSGEWEWNEGEQRWV